MYCYIFHLKKEIALRFVYLESSSHLGNLALFHRLVSLLLGFQGHLRLWFYD